VHRDDVQARTPAIPVGLSRVGVTGVEKVVRIREELFFARLECFVDLDHEQKGAHMSRFEEVVNEAIGEVVLSESAFAAEALAQRVAELVRERQGATRAEVTIAARYPEHKQAPVSGVQTQEIYTLYGLGARNAAGGGGLGDGHDGVPLCAGARGGASASAAERGRVQ
jgi:GTP cyclohydrolase IV